MDSRPIVGGFCGRWSGVDWELSPYDCRCVYVLSMIVVWSLRLWVICGVVDDMWCGLSGGWYLFVGDAGGSVVVGVWLVGCR